MFTKTLTLQLLKITAELKVSASNSVTSPHNQFRFGQAAFINLSNSSP